LLYDFENPAMASSRPGMTDNQGDAVSGSLVAVQADSTLFQRGPRRTWK
jgi:hypothetical protein